MGGGVGKITLVRDIFFLCALEPGFLFFACHRPGFFLSAKIMGIKTKQKGLLYKG